MLTGQNGILNRAIEAKEETLLSSEKEAISLNILQDTMNTNANELENRIGKKLYSKNFANSDKWDYIYLQTDGKIYGDNWYYINKGTNIENYGKAQKEWLVNYSDGEIIELEDEKYTEVSVNNVLITDGLVFNLDSNDFSLSDKNTWGDGVEAFGFDNNQEDSDGISFDGVDDYVSFKSGTDFQKGFTISFYGKASTSYFFSKQKENNFIYSCRFGMSEKIFYFNTSKNQANSTWSDDVQGGNNNGNLCVKMLTLHDGHARAGLMRGKRGSHASGSAADNDYVERLRLHRLGSSCLCAPVAYIKRRHSSAPPSVVLRPAKIRHLPAAPRWGRSPARALGLPQRGSDKNRFGTDPCRRGSGA